VTTGYHLTFQEKKFISFDNRKVRVPGDTEPVHVDMPQYREERDEEEEAERDQRPRELRDDIEFDADMPTRAEATEKGKNPPRTTRNPNPVMHALPDYNLAKYQFTFRRNFRKPTDSLSCWTILHSSFGKRMLCNSMLVKLLFVYVFAMLRSCYV